MAANERAQIDKALEALRKEKIDLKQIESEGLGDSVQKILGQFGITEGLIKRVLGKSCNCGGRRKLLNRLFPYVKK